MINVGITLDFPVVVWRLIISFFKSSLEYYEEEISTDPVFIEFCHEANEPADPTHVYNSIIEKISQGIETEEDDVALSLELSDWEHIRTIMNLMSDSCDYDQLFSHEDKAVLLNAINIVVTEIDQVLDIFEAAEI